METPLQLGTFKFSTTAAAFAELQRASEWTWAEQTRIGGAPALQAVGKGADTLTLPVVTYPGQYGRESATATLRDMADALIPYTLVDGRGRNHGQWAIRSISETQAHFLDNGAPRKIDFSLTLVKYA